ncbi:MAG: DEAD/DEAH box helicase family protein, partial [Candidatus Nanopelagicales bacterium]
RTVQRVIVVVPTDHLRGQWADAAARQGLWLDADLPNSVGPVRDGSRGYVATYAQVATKPMLHRSRTEAKSTLVIMDEIHHAGDGLSWGDGLREAFDSAKRRLALSGTPVRTRADERLPV